MNADRLRHVVSLVGGATAASQVVGCTRGTIYAWMRGQGEPSGSDIQKLCARAGVTSDWLIGGALAPAAESTFPSRLASAVEAAGGVAVVAERIEMTRQSVYRYMRSESQPVAADVVKLCEATGVRAGWLLTGEEPMRPGDRATLRQAITNLCEALEAHNQLLGALDLAPDQRAAVDNSRVTLLKPIAALAAVLREFARR